MRDTLLDLANYAIMTVMELDLAKPEPMDRETAEVIARMLDIDPEGKSTEEIRALCTKFITERAKSWAFPVIENEKLEAMMRENR